MIRVDDVSVSLGGVPVLDAVDLSVGEGTFVGLVGPNGAGKTTLLRTINGELTPDDGAVFVEGERIHGLSSRVASRRVATVPQNTSVRFAFDVADVVAMGRTPHRSRFARDPDVRDHVDDALERTGITHLRDRRVDTLSGGERQRVFIARAVAQDAPACVLDEPTASLDVNYASKTLSLVRKLADEGRAVLAAIHDLESAARFCDRLALVHDGRLVDHGPPEEVLTTDAIETAFDARSVVTTNPVTGSPAVTTLPATTDGTCRVHVIGGGETGANVISECFAAGHIVSAGPYTPGDSALALARALDVPTECVSPFSPIDSATVNTVEERIATADVTVFADAAVDPGGALVELAGAAERLLVVEAPAPEERNEFDESDRTQYEAVKTSGTVVDRDDIPALLGQIDGSAPTSRVAADD